MTWYRVHVELRESPLAIWRELLVPADLPLPELHVLLQAAMGWQNSHLHSFALGSQWHWQSRPHWVMDLDEGSLDDGPPDHPETEATIATLLRQPGDQATYLYDFGDGWEHLLTLVEMLDGRASAVVDLTSSVLTDGEGVCPPEDAGGIHGYAELLEAVGAVERGEQLEEWPEQVVRSAFGTLDIDQIHAQLTLDLAERQAALTMRGRPLPPLHPMLAAVVESLPDIGPNSLRGMVQAAALDADAPLGEDAAADLTGNLRWFLDLVGDQGLALTAAGYLRPAVVQELAQQLHLDREWIGSLNREDQTPGVADFRALVIGLGLVRKVKGRLMLTKAGSSLRSDPVRLLGHIADRMPLGREEFEQQASLLVMLDLLGSPESRSDTFDRCAAILTELGWRAGHGELSEWNVFHGIPQTSTLLERCGVLADGDHRQRWIVTGAGAAFLRRVLRGEAISV